MAFDHFISEGEDRRALLALAFVPGLGGNKIRALVHHLGSPQAVLEASFDRLNQVTGIGRQLASAIRAFDGFEDVDHQLVLAEQLTARLLTWWDDDYPQSLRSIYDPPVMLWVRGELIQADEKTIAVIGTRRPSRYGLDVTHDLTAQLVEQGYTIVSGLAYGIDGAAHRAALDAGGRTLAVLGSGVDRIYPSEHTQLAQAIESAGALISEFPLLTKPDAPNFPRRNRIVSGLAKGVLVVEAYEKGGALITAQLALEQNREVFSVAGEIYTPSAKGTNQLIRDCGAKLVQSVEDVLAELQDDIQASSEVRTVPVPDLNRIEALLYKEIGREPVSIDALCYRTSLDAATALVYLLSLEFKGLIRQMAGKQFYRSPTPGR